MKILKKVLVVAVGLLVLLVIAGQVANAMSSKLDVPLPAAEPVDVVWLDQGWTADDWQWYYHATQGGSMELPIPYSWMVAFEQPVVPLSVFGEVDRLMDPEYMSRLGFLPNERRSYDYAGLSAGWEAPAGLSTLREDEQNNPDGLPVGFVKTLDYPDRRFAGGTEIKTLPEVIGFNCSACHTGQLNYQGTGIRIEGGPAMTHLGRLRDASGGAMLLTYLIPTRFGRFADRVLGEGNTRAERKELKAHMKDLMGRGKALEDVLTEREIYPTDEGFARLDAVGRIGNYVLAEEMVGVLGEDMAYGNLAVADAPVNFPHIWDTPWLDWVQYNASFKLPIVRNGGEAMGVFAAVDFESLDDSTALFQSTINLANLYEMEALIRGSEGPYSGLRSPEWPEHILPPIDREAAARGEVLYMENCAGCHRPPLTRPDEFFADSLWEEDEGNRYLRTMKKELEDIGTDPNAARNMMDRTTRLGPLAPIMIGEGTSGDEDIPFVDALGAAILNVVDTKYDSLNLSEEDRAVFSGERSPPPAQAEPFYKARPLNGVWATPPFLHNGSVQNIYQLLGPDVERDSTFWLGTKEYDPVNLGYVTGEIEDGFLLDTGLSGNSRLGHSFEGDEDSWQQGGGIVGRALAHEERMDIIEFLKSMPSRPGGGEG